MDQDTSALRADIERERRELGETVAALAEKADVKGQAHRKIAETRESIDRKKSEVIEGDQRKLIAAAAVCAGILVLAVLVRRH
jgi:hypothetical protein